MLFSVFGDAGSALTTLEEFVAHVKQCKEFDFLTDEEIKNAVDEAEAVWNHMKRHATLPPINLRDHRTMQKGSVLKKIHALKRIKQQRRAFMIAEASGALDAVGAVGGGNGDVNVGDGVEPPDVLIEMKRKYKLVNELLEDQHGINVAAYGVM
jgi:hypothetical protein